MLVRVIYGDVEVVSGDSGGRPGGTIDGGVDTTMDH